LTVFFVKKLEIDCWVFAGTGVDFFIFKLLMFTPVLQKTSKVIAGDATTR
jgi:hypothetical protein